MDSDHKEYSCLQNFSPLEHQRLDWNDIIKIIPKDSIEFKNSIKTILDDSRFDNIKEKNNIKILDFGGGEGKFTRSLVDCIRAKFEKLTNIQIDLVEPNKAYRKEYKDSFSDIDVKYLCDDVLEDEFPRLQDKVLELFDKLMVNNKYDLVLASHVTYYYPDGGISLAHAIVSRVLADNGIGWFVVRSRESEFYKVKTNILNEEEIPDVNFHHFAESFERSIKCIYSNFKTADINYKLNLNGISGPGRKNIIQYLAWLDNLNDDQQDRFQSALKSPFVEKHFIVFRNTCINNEYISASKDTHRENDILVATLSITKCLNLIAESLVNNDCFDFVIHSASLAKILPHPNDKDNGLANYFPADSDSPVNFFKGFTITRFGYSDKPEGYLGSDTNYDALRNFFQEYPSFLFYPRFYIDHTIRRSQKVGSTSNFIYFFSTEDSDGTAIKTLEWDTKYGEEFILPDISIEMQGKKFSEAFGAWNDLTALCHLDKDQANTRKLWVLSIGTHMLPSGNYEWDSEKTLNSRCGIFLTIETSNDIELNSNIYPIIGHIKNTLTQYLASGVYRQYKENLDKVNKNALELQKKSDILNRHSDVLHQLMIPLRDMSGAITSMQKDAQVIKSLLYDPSESFFERHHLINDCFDDGSKIKVGKNIVIIVEHVTTRYSLEDSKLFLIYIICKLFEKKHELDGALTREEIIARFENIYSSIEIAQREHIELINYILDKNSDVNILCYLNNEDDKIRNAIIKFKGSLFTPFKFASDKWPLIALKIICWEGINFLPDVKNELPFSYSASPFNYKTVLHFVRLIINYSSTQNDIDVASVDAFNINKIDAAQEYYIDNNKIIILFKGKYWDTERTPIIKYRSYLDEYIKFRERDSISLTTAGNFTNPYYSLITNIIGNGWTSASSLEDNVIVSLVKDDSSFSIYYDSESEDSLLTMNWEYKTSI